MRSPGCLMFVVRFLPQHWGCPSHSPCWPCAFCRETLLVPWPQLVYSFLSLLCVFQQPYPQLFHFCQSGSGGWHKAPGDTCTQTCLCLGPCGRSSARSTESISTSNHFGFWILQSQFVKPTQGCWRKHTLRLPRFSLISTACWLSWNSPMAVGPSCQLYYVTAFFFFCLGLNSKGFFKY